MVIKTQIKPKSKQIKAVLYTANNTHRTDIDYSSFSTYRDKKPYKQTNKTHKKPTTKTAMNSYLCQFQQKHLLPEDFLVIFHLISTIVALTIYFAVSFMNDFSTR